VLLNFIFRSWIFPAHLKEVQLI